MISNLDAVTELYVGYYDRAPDSAGMDFWLNAMNSGSVTIPQVADMFANSAESITDGMTQPTRPDLADIVVYTAYGNLLNRAPDAAGLVFWDQQLLSGHVTVGGLVTAIEQSVNAQTGTADAQTLQAKVAGGEYFYTQTKAAIADNIAVPNTTENPHAVMAPLASHNPATATDLNNSEALTDQLYGGDFNGLPVTHHIVGTIDPPYTAYLA